jgi:chromosomal replication initiator protein
LELRVQSELMPAWPEIRAELRRVVGESTYDIWLAPLELKAWDETMLLLQAPPDTQTWVAERFGKVLERCARSVIGSAIQITFAGQNKGGPSKDDSDSTPQHRPAEPLNPRYTFDQFIIGDGNRLAHAAALAVAETPGNAYNLLFLHAPPGLGKTHLLQAIGNYVLAFGGGATVRYTTVEAFTNHFISALGSRSIERFKHAYRDADVLLIDDVQFLASKAKTEEEFFHTFNALHESRRQLVLTCDRLPSQLSTVQERLRERFEAGLVADIQPPDFATRLAILHKRAALDHIPIADPSVLELIAERVTTNIRVLEGALIRIVAYHSLTGQPIGEELARRVLDLITPDAGRPSLTLARIQATVASYYELSVDELLSASRAVRVAWPRQVAIYLAREHTDESLNAIGEGFGGRNHATVLHACKRVAERLNKDRDAAADLQELGSKLRGEDNDRNC